VIINDRQISRDAVIKLIDDGRKNIALMTTENYFNVSMERAEGYNEALRQKGIQQNENLRLTVSYDAIEEIIIEDFFKREKIDAVLCVNEIFAVVAMGIAQKLGFKIPENIAFIGFTDGILSKYSNPSLTTIAQHGERMGEIAARMLIEKVETEYQEDEEIKYRTEIIEATIIERESTR
ncbi:MAG: substrate-binding domain-containing protein, partial [Flavobacteriaceae bacterium]